jgi:hypothetical protein
MEAQVHGRRVLPGTGVVAGPEECDRGGAGQREDSDDGEGDLRSLAAESERLLGHEEHRQDERDRREASRERLGRFLVRFLGRFRGGSPSYLGRALTSPGWRQKVVVRLAAWRSVVRES